MYDKFRNLCFWFLECCCRWLLAFNANRNKLKYPLNGWKLDSLGHSPLGPYLSSQQPFVGSGIAQLTSSVPFSMARLLLHHQLTKVLRDENNFKDTFGEYNLALKYINRLIYFARIFKKWIYSNSKYTFNFESRVSLILK